MKKWTAFLCVLLLLCSLVACGVDQPAGGEGHLDWVWVRSNITHGAICDTGYYYTCDNLLHYADFKAGASTVLCDRPGCDHKGEECGARIRSSITRQLIFSDDRIYYFDISEPILYSRNATGIELKKIGTAASKYIEEQKGIQIGSYAIADGYLYYEVDVSDKVTTEAGSTTKLVMQSIGRVNLSTGKDEILIEEKTEKESDTKLWLTAVRGDGLLINYWSGLAVDWNDPDYLDALANAKSVLYYWNIETGEKTTLFEKSIRECSGISMVSGGKVYYKTHGSMKAEDQGYIYCYDLNTGKEEAVCERYSNWMLGGGYVQCRDLATQEYSIYDMGSGKVLPYELDSNIWVLNVASNGFVLNLSSDEEMSYYFVLQTALADGLQEADLIPLYTVKMGYS